MTAALRCRRLLAAALVTLPLLLAMALPVAAQESRETQRKLDRVRKELRDVATERRRIEGQRSAASRELRTLDERVGGSTRALRETETALARQQSQLVELRRQRDALRTTLAAQRTELTALLRAAYTIGDDAPLKAMLAQDSVAEGQRALAYHGYLQRQRATRIAALSAELAGLDALEREVVDRQAELDAGKQRLSKQVATLESDRKDRAKAVEQLEARFADRAAREKALGQDAKSLERVLSQLREAARRAKAEREAEARRQAAAARAAGKPAASGGTRTPPKAVASAPAIQVGGLGWPVSGALVAAYGATMPDGRKSSGLLIGAKAGTTVQAVADGTVVFAEWMTGYGLILIVDHGDGTMSLYAHNDALLKDPGDRVKRGDAVASVGNSGGQGRPGLYFELRRNGQPVDPRTWLQRR